MKETNGEYLRQEYYESCLKYPNINQKPQYHFQHLFFTNGNGIEFLNGNPHYGVHFNRFIPWVDYYQEKKTWVELLEFWQDSILDQECEDCFKRREKTAKRLAEIKKEDYSADDLFNKCCDDIQYQVSLTHHDIEVEDFRDPNFWFSTMTFDSYWPILRLSNGFFKLQHLNENTESFLLDVAIAFVEAYIDFYRMGYNPADFQPILGIHWKSEHIIECEEVAEEDLITLKKEIKRLYKLKEKHELLD